MEIYSQLIIVVSALLLGLAVSYLLYFRAWEGAQDAAPQNDDSVGMPSTAAERRALLDKDLDGKFYQDLKAVIRSKTIPKQIYYGDRLYRRAGITELEERQDFQGLVLKWFCFMPLALGVVGTFVCLSVGLWLALIGIFWGSIGPLVLLWQRGEKREHEFNQKLLNLLPSIRSSLSEGFDLATTIKTRLKKASLVAENDSVLDLFQLAIARSASGTDIKVALREISESMGLRRFSELSNILSMTEKYATGYSRSLDHLKEALIGDLNSAERRTRLNRRLLLFAAVLTGVAILLVFMSARCS